MEGEESKPNAKKPSRRGKKWTLCQYWRSANWGKRGKWIAGGIVSLAALGGVAVYIWDHYQRSYQFSMEHRPRIVFSRPPELLGQLSCGIENGRTGYHLGAMRVWLKNIKNGDAIAVSPIITIKLVPEQRTGIPFFDNPPEITEQTCTNKVSPAVRPFALNAGQETTVNSSQAVGNMGIVMPKDTRFQVYFGGCAYYTDEELHPHGTCQNYRFKVNGTDYGLKCDNSPLSGVFEQTFIGYCQN